ncbi:MAG: sugar ABC transporter permease [Anaerolineae bacterium]|nr:MAG: sugar ABC transporter permease [Anaerolineae bacterium]MCL4876954.1 sugar ABC transporter permease [Anaerolineae bacterium]
MIPLDYCTFAAERKPYEAEFGFLLVGIGMAVVLIPVGWISLRLLRGESLMSTASQPTQGTFRHWWIAIPLLAPTITILVLFLYYPSIETVRLSAHLSRLGAKREAFVCTTNYTRLVENSDYLDVVIRTMYISAAIVVLSMVLSLLIATMAYLPIRGASIYRTLLIWPNAISPAVAGLIFLLIFNPLGGIIDHVLGSAFRLGWTNDPKVAPWTIIIASVWKSMGYNILFYIAGLQNVPKDLIEAGAIDGAGLIRRFTHIVLPMLSPITFFLIITNMTYAFFDTYATIDYLTPGGGPLESTNTMMYQVAQLGVFGERADLGKAAAQSIVLFVMVIGMTIVSFRTGGRQVTYGA